MKETVYILLGTNLSERAKNLSTAIDKIGLIENTATIRYSRVYNSPAMEMSEPAPDFLNQAIEIVTGLSPIQLLAELKSIEQQMGRTDKGRYKSRNIDLDILLYGDAVVETKELTLPQARLLNRPFALIPLAEIAPDLIHPKTQRPVAGYITEADYRVVTPVEEHAAFSR